MIWTDQHTDQLCTLHEQGVTFGDIAKIMGIPRGAAAGKIRRLGLPVRATTPSGWAIRNQRVPQPEKRDPWADRRERARIEREEEHVRRIKLGVQRLQEKERRERLKAERLALKAKREVPKPKEIVVIVEKPPLIAPVKNADGSWPPIAGTVPISLLELPNRRGVRCRFGVGAGVYCGVPCGEAMYCPTHHAIMYGLGTPSEQQAHKLGFKQTAGTSKLAYEAAGKEW